VTQITGDGNESISGEQKECRVVYVEKEPTGPPKVAVEFTQPAPSFWRIAYVICDPLFASNGV